MRGRPSDAGHRYREFARYERASVDAFLFAAAVLEQLGASHDLVEQHRVAAREEAEHARLALVCAQSLDGCVATLGELSGALPDVDLERFVCDLIHDEASHAQLAWRTLEWLLEARPALASVVARELAAATGLRAQNGERGVDMFGLPSLATAAVLREQAITELLVN